MASQSDIERTVLEAIYKRRAVRSYQPGKLEEGTIRKLLDAAVHAPTAIHEEPWIFAVIQDAATLKRFSDRAKTLNLDEASRHRDLLKAPGAATSGDHLLRMLADPAFNIFYNASTLIVICGKPLSQYVTADCWLAAENLMLAAYAMGLGTCCIGFSMPYLNTPEAKAELGIPAQATAFAPIIVGVPSGTPPSVPRKPPEISRWIK
ncbi:MAG TPA: nitroreductase family protein [bacterium]|nr:nitroreductase family protein [bacterium]